MNFRTNILSIVLILAASSMNAETIVNGLGGLQVVNVASGEVIRLNLNQGAAPYFGVQMNGVTSAVKFFNGSMLAGPAALEIRDSFGNPYTSYNILNIKNVSSVILGTSQTHTITVPASANITIAPSTTYYGADIRIAKEGVTNSLALGCDFCDNIVLSGPLQVEFVGPYFENAQDVGIVRQMYTYYLTGNTFEVSDEGLIKGPMGSFEVILEKSTNGISDWSPVMIYQTTRADEDAAYRIRMAK